MSFDNDAVLTAAKADPVGFVARLPARSILDEVQRVPEIFTSLKAEIDRQRTPGRFILTGAANALLVPRLAESLAGRMEILRLHPLGQSEIAGTASRFIDRLLRGSFKTSLSERLGSALAQRIVAGGYPAALEKRLADWGNDEDEGDDEDGGGAMKGLPEKKRKKLLDPKTWERDGRLVEVATQLRAALGDTLFEDYNRFRDRVDAALKQAGSKLAAADLK